MAALVAFVAALCDRVDPQAKWPRDYGAEMKQVAADVGDSWRAVLLRSLIVLLSPDFSIGWPSRRRRLEPSLI